MHSPTNKHRRVCARMRPSICICARIRKCMFPLKTYQVIGETWLHGGAHFLYHWRAIGYMVLENILSSHTRDALFSQCNEFDYLSLIGIILRWGFLIWELIFIYCGLFVFVLVVFVLFLLSQQKKERKKERKKQHKNYQDEDKKSAINKN